MTESLGRTRGLPAAAVPLRPARGAARRRRSPRRRLRRPLGRHPDRPAARTRWSPRCARREPSGATRRRSAPRPTARRPPAGWHRRLGVDVDPSVGGGLHRHQGARRRAAAVAAPAPPEPRHRAVPGGQLPELRDGRDAGGLPGRAGGGRRRVPASTSASIDPADAERALCLWVNTPGNPAGGLDDLGAAAAWGRAHGVPVFSDECYVEFTWSGPPRIDPRARHRRGGGRPLAVEAVEPGRGPGRLLRRRRRPGRLPVRGAQARRVHGARARCRPPRSPPGATTTTSTASAASYRARLERLRRPARRVGRRRAAARGRVLPLGPGARRRRLGLRPPAGHRGRGAGQPGGVLRRGRRRPRPAGAGATAWRSSTWSPAGSACTDRSPLHSPLHRRTPPPCVTMRHGPSP